MAPGVRVEGYAFFRANYVVFTICITGYVVMLLYCPVFPARHREVPRSTPFWAGLWL